MKTIAVIFGGKSAEHDVSIVTALASIIKPLELSRQYRVEAVYIAKNGAWFWDDKLKDIRLFSSGEIEQFMARSKPASVQFDGGMTLVKAGGLGRGKQRKIDIVFPSMHGTYGEDGALMGLLDLAGIPYVGCGLEASVVAMDKVATKQTALANGLPSNKFMYFMSKTLEDGMSEALRQTKKLTYPMFVKPAHLGSSIAITKVANETELRNALEVAARYDDKIIVEEAVPNLIEVTLPIIGNHDLTPAYLEQPLVTADTFFDFETKYMGSGGKKTGGAKAGGKRGAQGYSNIPADISKELYDKAEAVGLGVYKALGCSGIARVDMLINSRTGDVFVNEVNPLPGSLYAHNWRQKGISNVELVTRLVQLAEERHAERQQLNTVFTTNFLQQF
ncbi:MAG TPA: D-alanine--D-alanine ligase family protein [Candidatus Saccharimonadales bacterium]|nr:D-alanine--D-alanine ligase family protein [Candidatus Saccharimonadales bacterium]